MPAPETGGIPALSLAGPQYTGVVSWSSGGGPHNGVFRPSAVYTATVTMQAASGRTFNGVVQDAFRHWAASTGVSNNADSGVVTIVFPATGPGEPVSSPIDLTAYIRQPVIMGQPVRNFRTAACYGTVEWEPGVTAPDGFFLKDTVYTAKVTLFPVTGYVFPGGLAVIHTKAAAVNITEANPVQAEVSIVFPDTKHILPLASGGDVSMLWTEVPGYYYETHIFKTSGTLAFNDPATPSVIADYLIVAGGGGSGGSGVDARDFPGGGGAGGLLYKAGETLALSGGSVTVTVGAGGAAGASQSPGGDGGYSFIGTIAVSGGGGGGAIHLKNGRPGGSGGGGSAGPNSSYGAGGAGKSNTSGNSQSIDSGMKGNNGGLGSGGGSLTDGGGGGGGAGSAGTDGKSYSISAGGAGWKPSAPENNGWS
ncbi:MAG: hypothetical protein LBS37_06165, partial [Treponema sp.]|nr:hypothetical protein [Treponema sp.]